MNIVYITDDKYFVNTCVSIVSVLKTCTGDVHIYVCVNKEEFTQYYLADCMLNQYENIDLVEVDINSINDLSINGNSSYVSATALIKFWLPSIFSDFNKILYLDGDTIVQNDLSQLYEQNLGDNFVAAVMDPLVQHSHVDILGIEESKYFNSGVMLLNLEEMRKNDVTKQLIGYKENGYNVFMDQDALNVVLKERKLLLPIKFNFLTTLTDAYTLSELRSLCNIYESHESILQSMHILHCTGPIKPWKVYARYISDAYMFYYNLLPFDVEELELESPIHYMKRTMRMDNAIELLVPYDKIKADTKLVIYGAGVIGKRCVEQIRTFKYGNIVLWVDMNPQNEMDISPIEDIMTVDFDFILIAIKNRNTCDQVKQHLNQMYNIDKEKILTAVQWKDL